MSLTKYTVRERSKGLAAMVIAIIIAATALATITLTGCAGKPQWVDHGEGTPPPGCVELRRRTGDAKSC